MMALAVAQVGGVGCWDNGRRAGQWGLGGGAGLVEGAGGWALQLLAALPTQHHCHAAPRSPHLSAPSMRAGQLKGSPGQLRWAPPHRGLGRNPARDLPRLARISLHAWKSAHTSTLALVC